jgi:hypothetical protein
MKRNRNRIQTIASFIGYSMLACILVAFWAAAIAKALH